MTQWTHGEFLISDEPRRLDIDKIHKWIAGTYWANAIPRDVFERSLRFSLCFGVYKGPSQVGFARVVSDFATFAYVADVFVAEEHRGQRLSKKLMEVVSAHPALQGLRRWVLVTRDAHALYEAFGFKPLAHAEHYMEKWDAEVYTRARRGLEPSQP